jgi:DHA3 family macrolide efflux protein-like MFS transporter
VTTLLMAASNILQFALSIFTLRETGSVLIFSTALSVTIFPRLVFTPISGVMGDRFRRSRIMALACFLSGITSILICFLYINQIVSSVFFIFSLIVSFEIFEIFFSAASAAMLPQIFDNVEALGKANTLASIDDELLELLSPVIGGFIYGLFTLTHIVFFISVLLLSGALICLTIDVENPIESIKTESFRAAFTNGVKYIGSKKQLLYLILVCATSNFVIVPSFSISIIYVFNNILLTETTLIGIYMSLISGTGLLTSVLLIKFYPKKNGLFIITLTSISTALLFIILSAVFVLQLTEFMNVITVITFSFIISSSTIFNIILVTYVQSATDKKYLSRTITIINFFATLSIPFGQLLFGFLIRHFSITYTFLLSCFIFVFAALLTFKTYQMEVSDSGEN